MAEHFSQHAAEAVSLRRAHWGDQQTLERFLNRDKATHLFVLSWLENHGIRPAAPGGGGFRFLLGEREGRLEGACLILARRTAMPISTSHEVAGAFGAHMTHAFAELEHIVGESSAVDVFWERYKRNRRPRLCRSQRYYVLRPDHFKDPCEPVPVRLARLEDLDALVIASAAMYREETLADPYKDNPQLFVRMHRHRILHRTSYLWCDHQGKVIFKADVSCVGRYGAQIAGVYTAPEHRGRGVARRALGRLCRELLRQHASLTLYVNDTNIPALRLYERLGFVTHCPYRTIFVT